MNNDMNKIISNLSTKLGVDNQTLSNAVNSKSAEGLMSALNPKDTEKLNRILNDEESVRKILQSEKVQRLIQKLSEGK